MKQHERPTDKRHAQVVTDFDRAELTADVTCQIDERLDEAATDATPPEYVVRITDIRITAKIAEVDGVEVEWCDEYTDAIVDQLASDLDADEVDDDCVMIVEDATDDE